MPRLDVIFSEYFAPTPTAQRLFFVLVVQPALHLVVWSYAAPRERPWVWSITCRFPQSAQDRDSAVSSESFSINSDAERRAHFLDGGMSENKQETAKQYSVVEQDPLVMRKWNKLSKIA